MSSLPRLTFRLPPDPSRLARARERVRDYLQQYCGDTRIVEDVVLAVQEACTNAMLHGDTEDDIEVCLCGVDGDLVAVVRDRGHGFDVATFDSEAPPNLFRADGRGLFLMAHLMDELELRCEGGLEARMVKHGAMNLPAQVPTVEGGLAAAGQPADILPRQARLHVLLEEIDEAFVALDWEYRVVHVNANAQRLLNQPRETMLERDVWTAMPAMGDRVEAACREAMELGKSSIVDHECPVQHQWFEIRVYPTLAGISIYLRNIDARKRVELEQVQTSEALRQKTQDLLELVRLDEVLLSVDQLIHSTLEIEEIMERSLERALTALDAEAGTVEMREGASWVLRFARGGGPGELGLRRGDDELPIAARVARTKTAVTVTDLREDTEAAPFAVKHGVRSALAVPLVARENVVGCLAIWSRRQRTFAAAEVEFARKLASSVSLALENSRLYEQETLEVRVGEAPLGIFWRVVYGSRVHPLWLLLASVLVQAVVLAALTTGAQAQNVYGLPGSVVTLVVVITGAIAGALVGGLAAIAGGALFFAIAADLGDSISPMTAIVATLVWLAAAVLVGILAQGLRAQAERRRATGIALAKAAAVRDAEQAEQRRVESLAAELRVERGQLLTMIEQTDTSIVILDREFRLLVVNSAYARGLQRDPSELLGRKHFDLYPYSENEPLFERARDTGEAVEGRAELIETPGQQERGATYWDWRLAPVKGASGEVLTLVLSLVDVTERVRSAQLGDTLSAINERIGSQLDVHHIGSAVLELAGQALGADGGWFVTKSRGVWRVDHAWKLSAEAEARAFAADDLPLAEAAVREQRPLYSVDYAQFERANLALKEQLGFTTAIAIPLSWSDGVVGCLCFINTTRRQHSASETDFVSRVSTITSQALENARLLGDVQRVAMTLQENLIHPLGTFSGIDLGRVSQTAYHPELVGGDFSHVFAVAGDRLGILIGDVEGKGIRAAGLTETVRSAVVAFSLVDPSPEYVLTKTNELLLQGAGKDQFVTACFLLVELASGATSYAIAGHPPPVLLRESSCASLSGSPGLPLGAFHFERDYELSRLELGRGDCLVLFTDGVTEARHGGELFGEKRVLETVRGLSGVPAQEVAERLRAAASAFANELRDDLQVLTVRYMRVPEEAGSELREESVDGK